MARFLYRYRWQLLQLGFILLVYLLTFSLIPDFVFWSPDEGAKFVQLHTLRWEGGLTYKIPYLGQRVDPDFDFYPVLGLYPQPEPDGSVTFNWPIWFPLISSPFFRLFGVVGLYVIPLVSGVLTAALAGRLAHRLLPQAEPMTIAVVGLTTPIFFYSLLFWEHTLATLLGIGALWQAMQINRPGWQKWLVIIVLLISAVALRLEMVFYAVTLLLAIGASFLLHYRQRLTSRLKFRPSGRLLLIGLIPLAAIIFFSAPNLTQGRWLGEKEQGFIERGLERFEQSDVWGYVPYHLRGIFINAPVHFGPELPDWLAWMGLYGLAAGALAAVFLRGNVRIWVLVGASLVVGLGSAYALLLPLRYRVIPSFFLPAPFLVFAFAFLPYAFRTRRFQTTLVAITTMLYLFVGAFAIIVGASGAGGAGLEWGPRFILTAYPLAGICAAVGTFYFYQNLSKEERQLLVIIVTLLLIVGLQYEVQGVRELQATKRDLVAYHNIFRSTRQPIVTDLQWLPAALATRFTEQEIYTLVWREDFYRWLDLVHDRVGAFTFVSFEPLDPDLIDGAPYPLKVKDGQLSYGMTFTEFEIAEDNVLQIEAQ
ncbi:MAG: DUF3488 domain-containing protein [Anaerolineae bacterium]